MPSQLCLEPRCPEPAVYRGRCRTHAPARDRQIDRAGYRIYRTARWRYTRRRYLFEHPICDRCDGIATDVHHRVDLAEGGNPWSFENLQGLCARCHGKTTRSRQAF